MRVCGTSVEWRVPMNGYGRVVLATLGIKQGLERHEHLEGKDVWSGAVAYAALAVEWDSESQSLTSSDVEDMSVVWDGSCAIACLLPLAVHHTRNQIPGHGAVCVGRVDWARAGGRSRSSGAETRAAAPGSNCASIPGNNGKILRFCLHAFAQDPVEHTGA